MKYILLSADSNPSVYLVPDIVADHLDDYCFEFLNDISSYENDRELEIIDDEHVVSDHETALSYDETAFIYWLNKKKFPSEPSTLVETLSWEAFEGTIPDIYKLCPWFNF